MVDAGGYTVVAGGSYMGGGAGGTSYVDTGFLMLRKHQVQTTATVTFL